MNDYNEQECRERPLWSYDPTTRSGREVQIAFSRELWNGNRNNQIDD